MGLGTSVLHSRDTVFQVSVALNGEIRVRGTPSDSFTQEDLDAGSCIFVHDSEPATKSAGFVFYLSFNGMTLRPVTFEIAVKSSSYLVSLPREKPSVTPVRSHAALSIKFSIRGLY